MKGSLFLLTGAVATALIVIFAYMFLYAPGTEPQFSKQLPTGIDGDAEDPQLSAHYYASMHILKPLMSLAGSDLQTLSKSVTVFASSSIASRSAYAPYLDEQVLYPIDIYPLWIEAEKLRQSLIDNPDHETAVSYHDQLTLLIEAYRAAILKLQKELKNINNEKNIEVIFWSGFANISTVVDSLDLTLSDIDKIKYAEERRFECLQDISDCPDVNDLKIAKPPYTTDVPASSVGTDPAVLDRAKFFTNYIAATRQAGTSGIKQQDVVLMDHSLCSVNDAPTPWLLLQITSRINELTATRAFSLNDIYLNDVRREQESGFLPSDPPVPEEYRYSVQPSNYYTCIDHGFDIHTILTIIYLRDLLARNQIKALTTNTEAVAIAQQANSALTDRLNDTVAVTLIDKMIDTYNTYGAGWFIDNFGFDTTKQILKLINVWQTRSGYFEYEIGMLDDFMISSLYQQQDGKPTLNPSQFLMAQSNFVSLYQIANPTVSPSAKSFITGRNHERGLEFPGSFQGGIISYNNDLTDRYTDYDKLLEAEIAGINYIREFILKDNRSYR